MFVFVCVFVCVQYAIVIIIFYELAQKDMDLKTFTFNTETLPAFFGFFFPPTFWHTELFSAVTNLPYFFARFRFANVII